MKYFLEISYDGTAYHGWQIQQNASSVQGEMNKALSTLLRQEILTTGSGRTDTGVHALNQVMHFETPDILHPEEMLYKLNRFLPRDIAATKLNRVSEEANARFSAVSRSYLYRIHTRKNPFLEKRSYLYSRSLDLEAMNQCCAMMKKWSDFESFSKVQTEVNNFICEIFDASWTIGNDQINFNVSANRFLRGMIRAMVGTMLLVGEGKINLTAFQHILSSKDRTKAGSSAPAHGLYLKDIIYPEEIYI